MKIALITDIHWGVRNDSPLFLNNMLKFYDEVFFPYLKNNEIKVVFVLGDTFDKRKYLNINTFHIVKQKFFDKFRDFDIKVFMLIGNHDSYYKNTNIVNSINIICNEYKDIITVIDEMNVFEFDGLRIGFVNWITNENKDRIMHFIKNADFRILCGHFEIKNFEIVKGIECIEGLDKSLFDRFDIVFSGHFHVRSSNPPVEYIGNPHQINWSDYGLEKGFLVFDTKTFEKKFIKNPFTIFEKIQYDDEVNLIEFDYELYKDKIVRVYAKKNVSRKKLNLFIDKLSSIAFNVEVFDVDTIDVDMSLINHDFLYKDKDIGLVSQIEQYIDSLQIENNIKDDLKAYLIKIYNVAQERLLNDSIS